MVVIGIILSMQGAAQAATRIMAVLPLDVRMTRGKLSPEAQASLEEAIRDLAVETLTPSGWTILTGETTLQVLRDNGVDPTQCGERECHLSSAREMKASLFISGTVQYVEGEYTASIRVIDTTTGKILSTENLEGTSVKALREEFRGRGKRLFEKAGLLSTTLKPTARGDESSPPATAPVRPPAFQSAGLEWQTEPAPTAMRWEDAKRYCQQLSILGGGWRLPTRRELLALFQAKRASSPLEAILGTKIERYWSSEPAPGEADGLGWFVIFTAYRDPDKAEPNYSELSSRCSARCVR